MFEIVELRRKMRVCFAVCLAGLTLLTSCRESKQSQRVTSSREELTEVDLFSRRGWDSSSIAVLGIRLGMRREETRERLNFFRYRLLDSDPRPGVPVHSCIEATCSVFTPEEVYIGLDIKFDESDRVSRVTIERIPEDAADEVRRAALTKKLKGDTYSLFNDYSSVLRKRLLGNESSVELDPKYPSIKRYKYSNFGVVVTVNANQFGAERDSDLSVTFANRTEMEKM